MGPPPSLRGAAWGSADIALWVVRDRAAAAETAAHGGHTHTSHLIGNIQTSQEMGGVLAEAAQCSLPSLPFLTGRRPIPSSVSLAAVAPMRMKEKRPRGEEWQKSPSADRSRAASISQQEKKRPLFRPPDTLQHAGQNSAISARAGSSPANEVPGVRQGNLHRKPVHGNRGPDLHVGRPCFTSSAACEAWSSPHTWAPNSCISAVCDSVAEETDGVQRVCQCHPHQHGCYLLHF